MAISKFRFFFLYITFHAVNITPHLEEILPEHKYIILKGFYVIDFFPNFPKWNLMDVFVLRLSVVRQSDGAWIRSAPEGKKGEREKNHLCLCL